MNSHSFIKNGESIYEKCNRLNISSFRTHAGSTECGSAERKLTYSFQQSDGGAHIGSSTTLTLDKKTLISQKPFGGNQLNLAQAEFSNVSDALSLTSTPMYETSWTSQTLKVISNKAQSLMFNEPVICKHVRYVGPPRP